MQDGDPGCTAVSTALSAEFERVCAEETAAVRQRIRFRLLGRKDYPAVEPFLAAASMKTCDYSAGGLMLWRRVNRTEFAVQNGMLFLRLRDFDGCTSFMLPLPAERLEPALELLRADCTDAGRPLRLTAVPEDCLDLITRLYPHAEISERRDYADYLYSFDELSRLHGRHFDSQRNQLHRFERSSSSMEFRRMTDEDVPAALAFFQNIYLPQCDDAGPLEQYENSTCLEALAFLEYYGFSGFLLRRNGEVCGFSICEQRGDVLFEHIEKADRSVPGAYQMLLHCTLQEYAGTGVAHVNREEDMGDAGLRTAKMRYCPEKLLRKYRVLIH